MPVFCFLACLVDAVLAGYIDLSKRRVSAEDMEKCEEKFNKSKAVRYARRLARPVPPFSRPCLRPRAAMPAPVPVMDRLGHAR